MTIITFLSDFSLKDEYVGCVKGVILSINSTVKIIDITHDIHSYSIEESAFMIFNYYNYFPENTIHLAVVDPGVGSERLPIIIKTKKYFFVGPDNGIFSYIIENEDYFKYTINTDKLKEYYSSIVSNTFHARDILGPAAGLLSKGVFPEKIGTKINKNLKVINTPILMKDNEIFLKILHVDHFGNIITNYSRKLYHQIRDRKIKEIIIKDIKLDGIKKTYSDVLKGEFLALWGSRDFLEISVNQGNAAKEISNLSKQDIIKIILE